MTEATRPEPDDAGVHQWLGRASWVGRGDIEAGIAELDRALAINPDLGYAHLQLGLLYALRGNYVKAERSCRVAIDLQERTMSGKEGLRIVGAYARLGYVYYLQSRYPEAIKIYERGVATLADSDHALKERSLIELHSKLAATYQRMDQPDDAARHFGEAVSRFERRIARGADDPATKYYIAGLYGLRGDAEKAARYLRESIAELPALNRVRAGADPDFDAVRSDPAFVEALAVPSPVVSLGTSSGESTP
jgi:tetratricopeptide (TPR) repeat protein